MSVGNHLFLPISKSVSNKWRKLDLCSMSISAMIGSYVFSIFVLPNFVCGFLLFSSFTYSLYSIFNIYNTDFTHCDVDRQKSTISIGISVIFFLIPILYSSIFYFSIIGSSYFVGALCFKYNFPEKYYPSKFCILGQGQQIMHIMLVIANITQFYYLRDSLLNSIQL